MVLRTAMKNTETVYDFRVFDEYIIWYFVFRLFFEIDVPGNHFKQINNH